MRLRDALREKIGQLQDRLDEEYGVIVNISNPKAFLICEKAAYVSFVLFILGLAAIGLLK